MARSHTTTDVGQRNNLCHSKTVAATSAAAVRRNSALQCCAKVFLCKLLGVEEEWRVTVVDNFFFSPPGLPITVLAQLQLRTALATFTITATCYCGAVMMTYSNI